MKAVFCLLLMVECSVNQVQVLMHLKYSKYGF